LQLDEFLDIGASKAATKSRLPLAVEGGHADEVDVSEGIDHRPLLEGDRAARPISAAGLNRRTLGERRQGEPTVLEIDLGQRATVADERGEHSRRAIDELGDAMLRVGHAGH
jgi:hypothetical protein